MRQYLDLLATILKDGEVKTDPQGVGNIAIPGYQMRFDLDKGFPLITTRSLKGSWKALVEEILWFLSGSTSAKELNDRGVKLWDIWATPEICEQMGLPAGELGRIYGAQWRKFLCVDDESIIDVPAGSVLLRPDGTRVDFKEDAAWGKVVVVDQIGEAIKLLQTNPDSRRIIVSAWNPHDINKVFVAPCHCFFQFIHRKGELTLHLFQRSCDVPVGVPFNIAEYSLLLMMVAQVVGMKPKYFVHTLSDAHIYLDQVDGVKEQLTREPLALPRVKINPEVKNIFAFEFGDFALLDYNSHPLIRYPVAL